MPSSTAKKSGTRKPPLSGPLGNSGPTQSAKEATRLSGRRESWELSWRKLYMQTSLLENTILKKIKHRAISKD